MSKVLIILGSTRPNRFSEKIGGWLADYAKSQTEVEYELVDLRDYPLALYNEPASVKYLDGQYTDPVAAKWRDKVAEADGYILVTPEYNNGYSAVLKNALDLVYFEWNKKPIAFVSYGAAAGGSRAVQQLKEVVLELKMVPMHENILINHAYNEVDDNGNLKNPDQYKESADRIFEAMAWWLKKLAPETK